jgi:RNA-directed DNA polymerase
VNCARRDLCGGCSVRGIPTAITSLQGIAEKAKADKQHRFQNLYRELNAEFLLSCWPDLNKDAASGVDKVTAKEYAEDLHNNIQKLADRLKGKNYRAKLVRRHWIPKDNGQLRPLGIPALEDKLVQVACAKILNAIYEQDFLDSSYGYRPEQCAMDVVLDLTTELQFGRYGYVVEADVKGFFGNMGHDWLIEMLSLRIDDRAFLNLIRKWLKAGILETDGTITDPESGSPQGGSISPVLANIYLHFALDLWFEKVVKPRCKGKAKIFRFADDWVCPFQLQDDAQRFYQVLPKRLEKFQLETAPEKTKIVRFSRFQPGVERRFTFLGFEFFWDNDRKGEPRVKRRTSRKKLQGACKRIKEWIKSSRHLQGGEFFRGLNARLVGHYNYYGVIGNSRSLSYFFRVVVETVFKCLNRRGGKRRSYTWEKFNQMLERVGIARPRITQVSGKRYA